METWRYWKIWFDFYDICTILSWSNVKEIGVVYKRDFVTGAFLIGFTQFKFKVLIHSKGFIVLWFTMTQGQLVRDMGEGRNGEGTRKRLKITVAHFDNSDLIKSCSKILVGRCMNPPAQEMKALLSNLPKIWGLVSLNLSLRMKRILRGFLSTNHTTSIIG